MTASEVRPGQRPVAVVTGAARGMGAAISRQLAEDGFDLLLIDAAGPDIGTGLSYPLGSPAELKATGQICRDAGAKVVTVAADVRHEDELRASLAQAPEGPLQAVVAAAGIIGADMRAWEFSREDLERDLDTNFHGVANLARVTVPSILMAPPGRGRFVAVVSTAGEVGLPRLAGYVSSKHAALGFIRALAADLGPFGVTANAVLPGSTRTSLLARSAKVYGLPDMDAFAPHQRLGRILEPGEIAHAVSFLCSAGSSAMTGAALHVDGGFV